VPDEATICEQEKEAFRNGKMVARALISYQPHDQHNMLSSIVKTTVEGFYLYMAIYEINIIISSDAEATYVSRLADAFLLGFDEAYKRAHAPSAPDDEQPVAPETKPSRDDVPMYG
jgi:hypothetical protein